MISLDAYSFIESIFLFICGSLVLVPLSRVFKTSYGRCFFLYVWHSIFGVLFIIYALNFGADAVEYYIISTQYQDSIDSESIKIGTNFILFFTYFFSTILGFSFFGVSVIYNFIGTIGLLALDHSFREVTTHKSPSIRLLATLAILIPSLSYWTSPIGKDALVFFGIGMIARGSVIQKYSITLLLLLIIFVGLIRPHIGIILLFALLIAQVLDREFALHKKIIFILIGLMGISIVLPTILNILGLNDEISRLIIIEYINERQLSNQDGGSSIDLSSMPIPIQILTYMFRPLPFDAFNLTSLAASIENSIFVLASTIFLFSSVFIGTGKYRLKFKSNFILIYLIIAWIILSITTANLGISMRQKWMVAPFLILLLLTYAGNVNPSKDINKNQSL